ncbi:sensor histidine kinase [Spirillospora sp. NPDC029432]|uniref:sensor histidine kinase n=1 Tax=Spirillospora sp. NPDC029432 TaxID=3154599 RepID=UPI003456AD18
MVDRTAPHFRTHPGYASKRSRGPFARWPRAADAVLAFAILLATVFLRDGPGDTLAVRPPGDLPPAAVPVLVVASAALYMRRRAPLAVLAVTITAWAVSLVAVPDKSLTGVATLIALYSAGRHSADVRRAAAGIAATILVVNIEGLIDPAPWQDAVVYAGVAMTGAWYVGRRLRLREEHAVRRLRDRAAEAGRIVAEERTRIARELHDVVAHRVSLMTVQAGAARAVATEDLDAALRAMAAVEDAGRQALGELRHLLGVLRPESELDGLGPQPGLSDLPRLAEQIRDAGVEVSVSADAVPDGLPARVDLFAYRIVQEALTNVLKHAGPGARTEVRLGGGGNGLAIEVLDDGRGGVTVLPGPGGGQDGTRGHGIVGMRERALLLGGTLDAGPRPDGGFRVAARLPTGGGAA